MIKTKSTISYKGTLGPKYTPFGYMDYSGIRLGCREGTLPRFTPLLQGTSGCFLVVFSKFIAHCALEQVSQKLKSVDPKP